MKKSTLVFFLTLSVLVDLTTPTPLFFDLIKKTFGGSGRPPNKNPWGSGSGSGGQFQKQKKFPWDIFGIFGYKNVIRPGRPNNGGYGPPAPRPTYGPPGPTFRPINPTIRPTFRPTTNRPNYRPTNLPTYG